MERALSGVKVLEYAQFVAGPFCAKLLADLGAEVIKIEPPGVGDEARWRYSSSQDGSPPEKNALFLYLNTNKLGITLDVQTEMGQEIFQKLTEQTDLLIEDSPAGVMTRLGLDYGHLSQLNPRLIMVSLTPFGQYGPYAHYKAYYLNSYHGGGLGYLTPAHTPYPHREPIKAGGFMGEYGCGLVSAVAALGVLYAQKLRGPGQHIDISKQEALLSLCRVQIARYANEGFSPSRFDQQRVFGDLYPCKDGYVVVMTNDEAQWRALVKLLGEPEWAKDERLADPTSRESHFAQIRPHILHWLRNHTREEIYHKGQALGCPTSPVLSPAEVATSEHFSQRGFFAAAEHPLAGKALYPLAPYQFSRTPASIQRPAPLLGQHNEEVYCQRLGYTPDDLAQMKIAGVL